MLRTSPKLQVLFPGVVVGSLLAASAPPALANDWRELGLDGSRGRASTEVSGTQFQPAWQVTAGTGAIVASPVVADGFVVVAGSQGELTALRAFDGTRAWITSAAGPVGASPIVDRGRIFLPTLNGRVQALRLADGRELWQRPFGGQNFGSPVLAGGSLVLAAGFPAQKLARLDAASGDTQWETAPGLLSDLSSSSPAVAGGQIVLGLNGGRYQSLDLATGAAGWHLDATGAVGMTSPLLVGDIAFFLPGGKTAELHAADRVNGVTLPGWPVAVTDPAAPEAATFTSSRTAVSAPARLGTLIVFTTRFEYDLRPSLVGLPSPKLLREYAVAVDAGLHTVVWQRVTGERTVESINEIPELALTPAPAVFESAGGPLAAVTSSVQPVLTVLDTAGVERWAARLSGATRSSPVFANGLLVVATDAGVVHAFESTTNRAPLAPFADFAPAEGELVETPTPVLRWAAARDVEHTALTYQVRLDADGELLESWMVELESAEPIVSVPHGLLQAGASYSYAVRVRDPQGALSPWSAAQRFAVAITPSVDVGGTPFDTLDQAIAAARPGSTVTLGRGLLHLSAPVRLPAGVSLAGAGPHDTILTATAPGIAGIEIGAAGARGGDSTISGVTVTGADTGISVVDGEGVVVRNVVLRDNAKFGLDVAVAGGAELVNATVIRNGTGARGAGKLSVRNTILTENGVGLTRAADGAVTSRYNDFFGNTTAGYDNVEAGPGDISAIVRFTAAGRHDFHLAGVQPTTDRGDPADDFAAEPAPNGARVNMGAFGNTASSELSGASGGSSTTDPSDATGGAAGCSMGGAPRGGSAAGGVGFVALAGILIARRRRKGARG